MKFPFRAIAAAFRERKRVRQPIPKATEDDVARIVRRDFPTEQFDSVMDVLSEYGKVRYERECSRVRLAALKLGHGDLESLGRQIAAAKRDYRDVLAAAEYPEYMRVSTLQELSRKEQHRIINSDWAQYRRWLQSGPDRK
jgi:hypothetical protein